MSNVVPTCALTLGEAARIMREALKDKSYQQTPIGHEIAGFSLRNGLTSRGA